MYIKILELFFSKLLDNILLMCRSESQKLIADGNPQSPELLYWAQKILHVSLIKLQVIWIFDFFE